MYMYIRVHYDVVYFMTFLTFVRNLQCDKHYSVWILFALYKSISKLQRNFSSGKFDLHTVIHLAIANFNQGLMGRTGRDIKEHFMTQNILKA